MGIPEMAAWVEEEPSRSVTLEYRQGHWEVVFNAARMTPVRVASARGEGPTIALLDCLKAGLKQVKKI